MQPDMEEQYDKIYRYCYFKLGNPQLAEDITQEAFLRSLESERFRVGGRPLAFLYTIARNLCIDEYRKRKYDFLPEELLEQKALESGLDQEEELADVMGVSRFKIYRDTKKILKKLERGISHGTRPKAKHTTGAEKAL